MKYYHLLVTIILILLLVFVYLYDEDQLIIRSNNDNDSFNIVNRTNVISNINNDIINNEIELLDTNLNQQINIINNTIESNQQLLSNNTIEIEQQLLSNNTIEIEKNIKNSIEEYEFIEGDDEENINTIDKSKSLPKHHKNVRKVEYLTFHSNSSSYENLDKNAKIYMVPYPGLKKYNGFLPNGHWISWEFPKDSYGKMIDFVQDRARKDGYYVPFDNDKKPINLHLFSTYEAVECLKNKRILIVGDSYMKQMYIGAVDILLQNPSNIQIEGGKYRELISRQAAKFLAQSKAIRSRNIHLSYDDKCIHSNLKCLMSNIMKNIHYRQADYLISNILVHDLELNKNHTSRLDEYLTNLKELFHTPRSRLMWVTGPSYDLKKVPDKYLEITKNRPTVAANREAFELAKQFHIPILDFYTLTGSCTWRNCSTDGGHRSRFVNRMKFQLVLNNICQRR